MVVGNLEVLFGIADDPAEDSYGRDTSSFATGASHRLRYRPWNTDAEPSSGCDSLSIEDRLLLLCEGIF
jgi:hypothetical protein